ncbi:fasciclin domain-containing protein [Denitrobaculum tricleocarpae]|uniref:Fasciclin domain-containing protein n=1 Tax=Denitrobaculum tricleocarpae TaxID=2591009 RepID=A0A545SZ58_9PROT|nr:fasciclin domain-containing protein [Denitrobaculum tricleocarpae]TQV70262.1 fasciclin domain-containing protein [Denitrobaculum tricleocarpae]
MRRIFTLVAAAVVLAGTGLSAIAGGHLSSEKSIVKNAAEAENLTTLVAAVQAAGLVEALEGEGPLTVFAPTDEAFAKLPAGTVEDLLKPENKDKLVAILTYHVVPGKFMASDLAGQKLSAATLEGSEVAIDASSGVKVDEATVVAADIEASNGVIHVIDTVIIPGS